MKDGYDQNTLYIFVKFLRQKILNMYVLFLYF